LLTAKSPSTSFPTVASPVIDRLKKAASYQGVPEKEPTPKANGDGGMIR
jgi:hypothetical protein